MTEVKDSWNFIVNTVNNSISRPETVVQNQWVSILSEIFGYSKLYNEIAEHEIIQIGSSQRAIPDILIKNDKNRLFLVELKCYNLPKQEGYVEQLKSYMRLLDLEIGLLVCNRLYIFCKDANGEYPYIEMPFEYNNEDGEFFIELFRNGNFDAAMIKDFVLDSNKKQAEIEAVRKALDEICADGEGFLKNYLAENKYSVDIVDQVFEEITVNLSIAPKGEANPFPMPTPSFIPKSKVGRNTLTKSEAIEIFAKRNYTLWPSRTTFASKNSSMKSYWANPSVGLLKKNWHLILNDWKNRILYLFFIPAYSISLAEIKKRGDNPEKIDLQIGYKNPTFTDSRSGYKFLKYKVDEINY